MDNPHAAHHLKIDALMPAMATRILDGVPDGLRAIRSMPGMERNFLYRFMGLVEVARGIGPAATVHARFLRELAGHWNLEPDPLAGTHAWVRVLTECDSETLDRYQADAVALQGWVRRLAKAGVFVE